MVPPHDNLDGGASDAPVGFEETVRAFEAAWIAGEAPSIEHAVSQVGPELRSTLLMELALVDMEFRWRAAQGRSENDALGARPSLRDYHRVLRHFPSVSDLPAEVLAEEFRVRLLWGDCPSQDRFLADYACCTTALIVALAKVRRQLLDDGAIAPIGPTALPPHTVDPRAPLAASDYMLVRMLGRGGMGKVYVARQKSLDRAVAIKALLKSRQTQPEAIEQFVREAQILARLRHPNIVGVHGLGRFPGGGYFLVMDLIEGEDLQSRIDRGPICSVEAVRVIREVAQAVAHAHERGIIHCDLKPANVIIDGNTRPIVTDFGLAQFIRSDVVVTQPSVLIGGTFGYMAPELMYDDEPRLTPAIDVYGLAALLLTMLTAAPPESIHRVGDEPERPTAIRHRAGPNADLIPPQFDLIFCESLAPDPSQRLRSVTEFLAALESCCP